jgi:hypothetical protein
MWVSLEPPAQVTSVPATYMLQSLQTFSLRARQRSAVAPQRREAQIRSRRVLYYLRSR